MRVIRKLGPASHLRGDVHPPRKWRLLPASWLEARERASASSSDDSESIGDAMDTAAARAAHAVWRNKDVLRGVPCVRNTRVPVYQICGMLAEGYSVRRVAKFLSLEESDVKAALRFVSIFLER